MTQLPHDVAQAMMAIVLYNWSDEENDYWDNCSDDPDDNQRSGHIFESLMLVKDYLEETTGVTLVKRREPPQE